MPLEKSSEQYLLAERFEADRTRLRGVAYRLLGLAARSRGRGCRGSLAAPPRGPTSTDVATTCCRPG
ncbi:hypothetical protein ACRAWD_01665 [Caulobacter segnis]